MNADFCPAASTDENYASFLDKELLCGSHIRNTEIHVTADDKAKWNAPFASGFYIGNGTSSRTVSLGFKPSLVIVMAAGLPAVTVNFTNSTCYSYMAMANDSLTSLGLSLTSTGFRVATNTTDNVTSDLNDAGSSYVYIAFKQ